MYKLYIVDDEPSARNGLRDYFDWYRYGIEVVGEGDDGETAFPDICSIEPDILITDVKMPNLDGMELSKKLRSKLPNMKIIFISAYSEIEYMRSALEVDAVDYILKPINLNNLSSIIEKTVKILNDEKKQQELVEELYDKLDESMPLLREKFFITLIRDEIDDISALKDKMDFLEITMDTDGFFCVFVISIDDSSLVFKNISEKGKQLSALMLMNLCENTISEYCTGYTFEEKQGEYVCILNLNTDYDKQQYYHIAQDIKDKILIEYEFSVTIGIGMTVHDIINLHKSYTSASKALGQKLYIGKNQIIFADENEANDFVVLNIDYRILDKISTLLKIADTNSLTGYLNELFHSIQMSSVTIHQCRSFLLQLYLTSLRVLSEIDVCLLNEVNSSGNKFWEILLSLETIQEIQVFGHEYLADLCKRIHDKNGKKSKNVIHKIKDIVHSRYQENITIQDIAKEVYLTHTYICLVFRQETGETINDYLTWYRVEKAKEMLVSSQIKLSEIGRSIGYMDASYFSKIFKKYTGVSPGRYREELAGNE